VWLLGARVGAELGREDKADWADRWQNPTRPWLLRWGKELVSITLVSSSV
jgi:hypothetical protein